MSRLSKAGPYYDPLEGPVTVTPGLVYPPLVIAAAAFLLMQ